MNTIPKTIHYIWVGPKPISKLTKKCIASWRKYLPDYEIKMWNERNFPETDHPYYKHMYTQKKWAFVSDYMRFWILQNQGGVYLDTDQEVLKNFDEILTHDSVWGRASDGFISCGFIASSPNNEYISQILAEYESKTDPETSPQITTRVFQDLDQEEKQRVRVLDAKYIYPCNAGESCTKEKLQHAYTNHHWAESWVSFRKTRKFLRPTLKKTGILSLLKNRR